MPAAHRASLQLEFLRKFMRGYVASHFLPREAPETKSKRRLLAGDFDERDD